MMYTADDVRHELINTHGAKLSFALKMLDNKNLTFKVERQRFLHLPFNGDKDGVQVDDRAPDLATAAAWALDGLRDWAGTTSKDAFAEITREWAKRGEGSGNTAASLGTTIDWLYLFSGEAGSRITTGKMYRVFDRVNTDLFNIYCWAFTNMWDPTDKKQRFIQNAMVNVTNHVGLNRKFWDGEDPLADQTHHFAGYFYLGAHFGTSSPFIKYALDKTGDYDWNHQKVKNSGDVELGWEAAKWGSKMRARPNYYGKAVEYSLR